MPEAAQNHARMKVLLQFSFCRGYSPCLSVLSIPQDIVYRFHPRKRHSFARILAVSTENPPFSRVCKAFHEVVDFCAFCDFAYCIIQHLVIEYLWFGSSSLLTPIHADDLGTAAFIRRFPAHISTSGGQPSCTILSSGMASRVPSGRKKSTFATLSRRTISLTTVTNPSCRPDRSDRQAVGRSAEAAEGRARQGRRPGYGHRDCFYPDFP